MKKSIVLAAFVGLLCGAAAVQAQGWGDLTATFVMDGSAPKSKPLMITKDPEVCGKHGLVDESLVVNPTNHGIADVVVYLYVATRPRPGKKPPVHESYKALEKESVRLDNHNCRFEPRVLSLRTTQTLIAGNKDPVGHNTKIDSLNNPGQNILIPGGSDLKFNFPIEESLPTTVSCSIHTWMSAFIVIKEHPYVGVSDKNGKVTIKNVPTGKWTYQFWQQAAGYVADVNLKGKAVKWERGRVEIDIKAGANDLGEVKLSPSIFKVN